MSPDLLGIAWVSIIDNGEKLVKIAAIVVGGLWAYYRFFRGRTFRPRIEMSLTGTQIVLGEKPYLYAVGLLKNVGLSKVEIDPSVSGLRVLSHAPGEDHAGVDAVAWEHAVTLPAFGLHRWIEPGEVVNDHWLLSVPKAKDPVFRFELRVAGTSTSWSTATVALPSAAAPLQ